jgi:hypothetical protein
MDPTYNPIEAQHSIGQFALNTQTRGSSWIKNMRLPSWHSELPPIIGIWLAPAMQYSGLPAHYHAQIFLARFLQAHWSGSCCIPYSSSSNGAK